VSVLYLIEVSSKYLWALFPIIATILVAALNVDETARTVAAIIISFVASTAIQVRLKFIVNFIEIVS